MSEFFPVILDFETYSECDLRACGSYVYAEHPTTEVICAFFMFHGYRIFWTMEHFNVNPPPGVIYEHGYEFIWDLFHQPCIMIAHNVDFERPISQLTLGLPEPPGGWRDTMDQTLMRGLPAGADAAGEFLLGRGKDKNGYALMMQYCKPRRDGTKPVFTDDVINRYLAYNEADCIIQQGIVDMFGYDIHPEWENRVNQLHREINHRGVAIDIPFATTLREFDDSFKTQARAQVEKDTKGEIFGTDLARNEYIRQWLASKGLLIDNMRQDTIVQVLDADEAGDIELSQDIYSVLTNRLVVTRAALSKVDTAIRATCSDGRLHALFRYWGAHTGRFSGKLLQAQNLKKPLDEFEKDSAQAFQDLGLTGGVAGMSTLELAIQAVENRDRSLFEKCCIGMPPYELLSSLVRGIIVPKPGCKLVVGDFAAIEARVLLWMAEDWTNLAEYTEIDMGKGQDIYCRFASFLYGREITKKDRMERGIGKIGILATGYQGGAGAVNRFAYAGGIDLTAAGIEPKQIVDSWRAKHPLVVRMWYDCERAFRSAIDSPGKPFYAARCEFVSYPRATLITLPSGRVITYMHARIEKSRRVGWEDRDVIVFDTAVKGQIRREETHSGKIAQNIDQAIASDLLRDAMLRIADTGDELVMHVHDEAVCEVPEDMAEEARQSMQEIMRTPPAWCRGIPLGAKPTIERRYGK